MNKKETNKIELIKLAAMLILCAVLAACAPTPAEQEIQPVITQTIIASKTEVVSPTPEASATLENTPTITATATPENTPTPKFTATPEAMTQTEIRAEILAAGVNLDDLANSEDEWTSSHMSIEYLQDDIDNLNFNRKTEGFITTVVIGLEAVENLEELEQALLTDGGWKLTTFAKLAYKDINGDWQIIKVPLNAYHPEDDLLWMKDVSTRGGKYFADGENLESFLKTDNNGNFTGIPFINTWTSVSIGNNYHWGTGSIIRLCTCWVEDPKYANNDCVLGDPPRYSEEQLIEFRKTGDPSIFGYQDSDGYYIFWPLVTFNADVSEISNYDTQAMMQSKYYDIGEWVKHEDAWLKIIDYEINNRGIIEIDIEIWNKSPEKLVFSWNPGINFKMSDNTGHVYEFSGALETSALDNEEVDAQDLKVIKWKETSATLSYSDEAILSADVTDLYLTIDEFSVFKSVKFIIPIR